MLYPTIELEKKHTYCTCGTPNFRSVSEWDKPIKRIYKLTIPKNPYGTTTHYLCEDCIKRICEAFGQEADDEQ